MSNSNIISLLNNRDKQILIHIYKFRGLTFEQILNTLYSNNGSPKKEYCRKRISLLKKYELIEKVDYPSHSFYFLTTRGAILVKNLLNLSIDIDLKTKRGYSENYFMASELKFKQPLAEHQYYLNEFVLNFCNLELPIDYKFYSEKNVCKLFDYARPDAVIETDNMYYCLEMDMGTERINKLNNKWTTYRDLLMSSSFSKIRKPITILFFIKSNNINHREKICIDTFYSSLFDLISDDFNLYTGDIDHCFNKLIESIKIQLIADTSIQDSMSFKNYQKKETTSFRFSSISTGEYYRILNENKKIATFNNTIMDFFCYDFRYISVYTLKLISLIESSSIDFFAMFKRKPRFLIFVSSLSEIADKIGSITNFVG